jgi:hypothetical protein
VFKNAANGLGNKEATMHGTISMARDERQKAAREKAYSTPLSEFHVGAPELFRSDTLWPYFERLRKEEPVHYCTTCPVGDYWSVTKYNDIMHVDTNAAIFSSDVKYGGISLRDVGENYSWPSFIAMDEPKHGPQRKTVQPMFTPVHLDRLAVLIRERSAEILDNLPRNETFDWVDTGVDRADDADAGGAVRLPVGRPPHADALVVTSRPRCPVLRAACGDSEEERLAELDANARATSSKLWKERVKKPGKERPALDDGAQRRDASTWTANELPRQPDPADRRRQ